MFTFSNWSIRKTLTTIVLLATLPVVSVVFVAGLDSRQHIKEDAIGKTVMLNRSLAAMQLGISNEAKVILSAAAQSRAVMSQDIPGCNELFSSLYKIHPDFFNVLLLDSKGVVIASGRQGLIGVDLSQREYIKSAYDNKTFSVSGYVRGITTHSSMQLFAFPTLNDADEVQGVLVLSVLNSKYQALVSGHGLPDKTRVTFIDSQGTRMLAQPDNESYPEGQLFNAAVWRDIENSAVDEWTQPGNRLTGESVLFTFLRLRLTPTSPPYMTIVTSVLEKEVYSRANALFMRNMAMVGVAAALALVISWMIGGVAILRSLNGLTHAASRLGGGDLSARADPNRGCLELRQLASTFNGMAQVLTRRQDELTESAEALTSMRNLLNSILESMPSGIIGLDAGGRITHWNHGAEMLAGLPAELAVGAPLAKAFPWLDNKLKDAGRTYCAQDPVIMEKCPLQVGKNAIIADVLVYPLVGDGVSGAVVRIDDISRRVQIEELMIQAEKMSIMGRLAAGMAHDINNPLAGILQSVQVIQRRISPEMKSNSDAAAALGTDVESVVDYLEARDVMTFLQNIKSSGERAHHIVKNMLGFIRKSASDLSATSLQELMDSTIEVARADFDIIMKYDFKDMEIVREYDSGMALVTCSASAMQQVFYNLIVNAVQAMTEHSCRVEPPRLTLRIRQDDSCAVVEIEDNGPGMSEEIRNRIFEPMFSTKNPNESTGIGLSIVYFIVVDSHHGSLHVESTEGVGTKFIVRIPMKISVADGNQGGISD